MNRTQTGSSWRLRPWERKESRSDDQKPCKRAQKERERIGCRSTGPLEKGTCEAPSCEVSKRECDEETDCIVERRLVEFRQRYLSRVFETAMTRRQQRPFQPAMFLSKMGAKNVIALFREGQVICSQGDAGKEVFYIEKGQVKITVKSKRGKETA